VAKRKARRNAGSGNVFADLGLPNPEQELLKARLTLQIYKIVKTRGLTQARAGEILGIKQPRVSALMRNRAGNFSIRRLMEFLTALGQDVRITVKPTRKAKGEMAVVRVARRFNHNPDFATAPSALHLLRTRQIRNGSEIET
jgi:predicted XRE-type DNA-binding protein